MGHKPIVPASQHIGSQNKRPTLLTSSLLSLVFQIGEAGLKMFGTIQCVPELGAITLKYHKLPRWHEKHDTDWSQNLGMVAHTEGHLGLLLRQT